jgi:hypothetical protein
VLNVQYRIPDDGQRGCPKHVEFYNRINLRIGASGWLLEGNVQDYVYNIQQAIKGSLSETNKIVQISKFHKKTASEK